MNTAAAALETFEPIYFVQASHWGLFPYARKWDGSYPLEDYCKDYGLEFHFEDNPAWDTSE